MAAHDNINPQQLAMLMTAQELHDIDSIDVQQTPESRFGGAWKSKDAMWKTKRAENRESGLKADIAARGVERPVELTHGRDLSGSVLRDGHHRVQASFELNPKQLLPVVHSNIDSWLRANPEDDDW
jgi:hypothetical protein